MQEMIELSSQQQKEQQLPPRAVQIISHPFFGRVVLTAGPAQFGMDLSKHSSGVCALSLDNLFSFNFMMCVFWELLRNRLNASKSGLVLHKKVSSSLKV